MQKINVYDIEGMEFPAGRRTRVMLGENGAIRGGLFCQGYVVIYPDGSVPLHEHAAAETYTVLQGSGVMAVGGEEQAVKPGDMVYIPSGRPHSLRNTGTADLHMMFVYAPGAVADHWAEESRGTLR